MMTVQKIGRTAWTRSFAPRRVSVLLLAAAAAGALCLATPGEAQTAARITTGAIMAPVVRVAPGEQAIARRIDDLTIGRTVMVELPSDAKEVFVANPKIADAVIRSARKLFVIGMERGSTSIMALDADGRQIAALDVTVGRDLSVLRQTLRTLLPSANIELKAAGDSIVMTGTVNSASDAQQAADIAQAFVGQSGGTSAASGSGGGGAGGAGGASITIASSVVQGKVINALTIKGRDQVMLKVTVVEVARNVLKQFGINTQAGWSTGNFLNEIGFPVNSGFRAANPDNGITGRISRAGFSASATLKAFERAGVSRILAEPTLTAVSGENAKFLVGGEIPIPTGTTCSPVAGAGNLNCTTSVLYKQFGVVLNFTPVVLSEGRISLRVGTEVSEIDTNISAAGIPGFRVRRSETTVELPSGAVMMTAGLIQQTSRQAIEGLPGMLNLPVLGTLFRSRDYQRQETEMMIMVTPYIAKPMESPQAQRPDDGFVDSADTQAVLLGRLNRLYGVAGAPPLKARAKGHFGFITD
jgi:pilus assembly protein CpaC